MEEASVFVHVAVNDVTGKVGKVEPTEELKQTSSIAYRQNGTCGFRWLEKSSLSRPQVGNSLLWAACWSFRCEGLTSCFYLIYSVDSFTYLISSWSSSHLTSFAAVCSSTSLHFSFLSCVLAVLICSAHLSLFYSVQFSPVSCVSLWFQWTSLFPLAPFRAKKVLEVQMLLLKPQV